MVPRTGCLRFVENLDMVYNQRWDVRGRLLLSHLPKAYAQIKLSLRIGRGEENTDSGLKVQVGDTQTDWKSYDAVRLALQQAMAQFVGIHKPVGWGPVVKGGERLESICQLDGLARILWRCEKECPNATSRVMLGWGLMLHFESHDLLRRVQDWP